MFAEETAQSITASDTLTTDITIRADKRLLAFMDGWEMKRGGKIEIDESGLRQFQRTTAGYEPVHVGPGGSSANTLDTLNRLRENALDVDFYGVDDMFGENSRSFAATNIKLRPASASLPSSVRRAVSYVFLYPDNERSIATCYGDTREILPGLLTPEAIRNSHIAFLQTSLEQKCNAGVVDNFLKWRWDDDANFRTKLWLALPTNRTFGIEKAGRIRYFMGGAELSFANDTELARTLGISEEAHEKEPGSTLYALNRFFRDHSILDYPIAFITCGKQGAAVVTRDVAGVIMVPALKVPVVSTLGAGDNANAGFAYGLLNGWDLRACAEMGVATASAVIQTYGSRLENPHAEVTRIRRDYAGVSATGGPQPSIRPEAVRRPLPRTPAEPQYALA